MNEVKVASFYYRQTSQRSLHHDRARRYIHP